MVKKVTQNPAQDDQDMGNNKITNLQDPASAQDAATQNEVSNQVAAWASNPASQNVDMASKQLNNLAEPTSAQDAATQKYVQDRVGVNASEHDLLIGMRSFYSLDGNVVDRIGNNDGTNNGATFVSGLIGQAAAFTSSDYITIGDAFAFGTGDFSVQCFFKPTTNSTTDSVQVFLTSSSDDSGDRFSVGYLDSGEIRVYTRSGGNYINDTTTSTFPINDYLHIVLTRTGSSWKLYVNNNLELDSTLQSGAISNTQPGSISRNATSSIVNNGEVDVVGSWDRVLTSDEVEFLYNNGNGTQKFVEADWYTRPAQSNVDMKSSQINNLADPTSSQDASTQNYTDNQVADWASNPASTNVDMGTHKINNLDDPTSSQDAATQNYVAIQMLAWASNPANTNVDMAGNRITDLADAVNPTDAAAFDQVDARTSGNTTVRQTVQNGHIDSKGKPNLLVASGGDVKTQGTNDLLDKIMLYYDFDSMDSNDDFTDQVNGQKALNNNGVDLDAGGIRGNCARINNGGQLEISNQLNVGDSEFFLSIWIKCDSSDTLQLIVNESATSNSNSFFIDVQNDNTYAMTTSDGSGVATQVKTNSSYDVTEWHYVVYHRNGSNLDIYVDDVLDGSGTIFGGNISANGDSVIGDSTSFIGYVDEMGLWRRAVTSSDLELLYNDPINVGLESFYSLNGDGSNELSDGQAATVSGGSFVSGGLINQAFQSDADGEEIDIPQGDGAIPGSGAITLSHWVFITTTSRTAILSGQGSPGGWQFVQRDNDMEFRIEGSGESITATNGIPSVNEWYHLVIRSDFSTFLDFFLDGNLIGSISNVSSSSNGWTFLFQAHNGDRVDLISAWKRSLSDNEISLLYRAGKGRSYDNMRDLNPLSYNEFSHLVAPHLTMGDGFNTGGQRNFGATISTPKMWDLSSYGGQDVAYLYLDYDDQNNTLTPGSTSVRPLYSYVRPSTAQVGQYWYPIDHRSRGQYLDNNGDWQDVLRIFVGGVIMDDVGNIGSVHTFSYLGRAVSRVDSAPEEDFANLEHEMGTLKYIRNVVAIAKNGLAGYSAGTRFDISGSTPSGWVYNNNNNVFFEFIQTHGSAFPNFTRSGGGPASSDPSWSDFELEAEFIRSF